MSLEMTFADLLGDEAYQPTIAVIKGIEIGLGLPVCPPLRRQTGPALPGLGVPGDAGRSALCMACIPA